MGHLIGRAFRCVSLESHLGGSTTVVVLQLLGAVALLGGIQRSSLSLVVIIVEGTGKVGCCPSLPSLLLADNTALLLPDRLPAAHYHHHHYGQVGRGLSQR